MTPRLSSASLCATLLLLLFSACGLTGCRHEVARGLAQAHALELATQLRAAGIDARSRGRGELFSVHVARPHGPHAEAMIVDRQLFERAEAPQTFVPRSGLESGGASRAREDERASQIATALRAIPGVRDARVSLTLCEPSLSQRGEVCHNPNQLSAMLVLHPGSSAPAHHELVDWLATSAPQLEASDVSLLITRAPSVGLAAPAPHPEGDTRTPLALLVVGSGGLLILIGVGAHLAHRRRHRLEPRTAPAEAHNLMVKT